MILPPEVDGWGKYIIREDLTINHVGFMAQKNPEAGFGAKRGLPPSQK
jgi:hypothetical protein